MMKMRTMPALLVALFLVTLWIPLTSYAAESPVQYTTSAVEVTEPVDRTALFAGEGITIEAPITGDLFVFGNRVDIQDDVDGDVFIFAASSNIDSHIAGNVYCFNDSTIFRGKAKSFYGFMNQATFGTDSVLTRDVFLLADTVNFKGLVERDAHVMADQMTLNGAVQRDFYGEAEAAFRLGDQATIGGDLTYKTTKANVLSDADESKVKGVTAYTELTAQNTTKDKRTDILQASLSVLWTFLALLVMWGLVRFLYPGLWEQIIAPIDEKPAMTGIIGLASVVLMPLAFLLLMISIIGIPLGLAVLFLVVLFLIISKVLLAVSITKLITGIADHERPLVRGGIVVAVILCISLAKLVPVLGPAVTFLACVLAMGLLIMNMLNLTGAQRQAKKEA